MDLQRAEPIATIVGFRALALLPRQPSAGVAYEAVSEDGRQVWLRVLAPEEVGDPARFLSDARALSELGHHAIPAIYAFGEGREGLYVAGEPVEGHSLEQLTSSEGGLTPMRALHVLADPADALDAAHSAGVLHRALRPASVLVQERPERALLTDFALGASPADGDGERAAYVSPEEVAGEEVGPASDVYSFACVMFEAFAGAPPFLGETPDQVRRARLDGTPPRATDLRPELPAELDETLVRGLARRPADRPSAAELVAGAAQALMGTSPGTSSARAANPPPPPWATPTAPETAPLAPVPPAPFLREPIPAVPAGPPRTRLPRLRRALGATLPAALALLLVGGAAAGGWFAGDKSSGNDTTPTLSSAALQLDQPAGWRAVRAARAVGGLRLRDAVAARGAGGELVAGSAAGVLPQGLAGDVSGRPRAPETVRLGSLEAYRWRKLRERGRRRTLTLFALPAGNGLVALACRGSAAARSACEQTAGSLTAPGAEAGGLSALRTWAARLDRTLRGLNRKRAGLRSQLRRARNRAAQGRAAARLARAHSTAARAVAKLEAPASAAEAQRDIVAALRRVSAAYARLGAAARRGNTRAYRGQGASIARREAALGRALRRL